MRMTPRGNGSAGRNQKRSQARTIESRRPSDSGRAANGAWWFGFIIGPLVSGASGLFRIIKQDPSPRPPPLQGEGEKSRSCSPSPLRGGAGGRGLVTKRSNSDYSSRPEGEPACRDRQSMTFV